MVKAVRSLAVVSGVLLVLMSCKNSGGGGPDGGPSVKLVCKMNQQCWICPTQDAVKKCIINPVTSGCKQAAAGDCP